MANKNKIDKRFFSYNDNEYSVDNPPFSLMEKAEQVYSDSMASFISRGRKGVDVLFRSQLDEFLKENGIWTDKDEKAVLKIQIEKSELEKKLKRGGIKVSEGRDIAVKMFELTQDILNLMTRRQTFDENTAEARSEKAQKDYLVWSCTYNVTNGKRAWADIDEMLEKESFDIYKIALNELNILLYGTNDEFLELQPEIIWLKEYGYVNSDLQLVDRKTGKRVDPQGNPIEENKKEEKHEPFIDDETNEPIVLDKEKSIKKKKRIAKKKKTKEQETVKAS